MEQKELLNSATKKVLDSRKETISTKNTIKDYYEFCSYNIDNMSFNSYCRFIFDTKVKYTDAIIARRIIRSVLVGEIGEDPKLWPNGKVSEKILSNIDLENESVSYFTKDQWDSFSEQMESALKDFGKRGLYNRYLLACLIWHGVSLRDVYKININEIEVEDTYFTVRAGKDKTVYRIDEKCALDGIRLLKNYDNTAPLLFKSSQKFTSDQIDLLKTKVDSCVLDKGLDDIHTSGLLYRMSLGERVEAGQGNKYLSLYYEAMSRFLYGEPLSSGEPSSSAEPQQTPPDKIDVEKEAKKYILDWQWERFASQVEAMIDLLRLDRLEPFFEYYLAWNGIPVELISLLTPKNISTNGEDRIYITDGRHEIEIEASKNTALKLQDFILVAGDKVFEEIQGYTEETLPRLFIGARDLGFTNTVEEIYISGILYRLAKFGQEPDDKENLNYYKAVADYMYKGDD